MDICKLIDKVARAHGFKKSRTKLYVRVHEDVHHIFHLDKGTWSRNYQLSFVVALDYDQKKRLSDVVATIHDFSSPCEATARASSMALQFGSQLGEGEALELLSAHFDCIDEWMKSFGNRANVKRWLEDQDGYYLHPSIVRVQCYDFLDIPRPYRAREGL